MWHPRAYLPKPEPKLGPENVLLYQRTVFWRLFLPILYLDIRLPLLHIRTAIMFQSMEREETEYISLDVRIIKWKFSFALYTTYKRKIERHR